MMKALPIPTIKMNQVWSWFKENLLLVLTFLAVITGFILGLTLRELDLTSQSIRLVAYPGELFMRLLKLMILPLVIASLITGSASLNAKMNGMIALRTILFFILTSLLSAVVGLCLVVAAHPGNPATRAEINTTTTDLLADKKGDIMDNFLDLGRNLVPDNLFQAAFETAGTRQISDPDTGEDKRKLTYRSGTNTLGIIFFCLTFGTCLGSVGPRAKPVIDFWIVIDDVIMRMVSIIMWISPVGIASVISAKILLVSDLASIMSQLGYFILTVCGGIFLYQFTILQAIFFLFTKKNPFEFWWGIFQAWMTAFATASTAAALPITFRCMMNNIQLSPVDYVTVVLTSTAASIASASVPSAALVLMLIVLTAIDVPVQDVSLLWAVDWFVDRCRTTNNMLGDCYGAAVVEALSKKELEAMDSEAEKERRKELAEDLERGHETIVKKCKQENSEDMNSAASEHSASSGSLNGSSVEVPAVIIVDDSEKEEDIEDQKL